MSKVIKFVLSICVVVAIAVVAAVNVVINSNSGSLSDLQLANIEALARAEDSNGQTLDCYNTISNSGILNQTHRTYCGSCSALLCRSWSDSSTCN